MPTSSKITCDSVHLSASPAERVSLPVAYASEDSWYLNLLEFKTFYPQVDQGDGKAATAGAGVAFLCPSERERAFLKSGNAKTEIKSQKRN